MAIPDYQMCMLPLLQFYGDEKEHSHREAVESVSKEFRLTDQERREMLPSGRQQVFDNRVAWARFYFKKAGLIDSPRRGITKITQQGLEVLKNNPKIINTSYLMQFESFRSFKSLNQRKTEDDIEIDTNHKTPEELLESAYQKLRAGLVGELIEKLKSCSPSFFERVVIEVIVKMGYGGTRKDAGESIGKSGDGGIDGIIKEDKLGLDTIFIQAKRWENTVGRPEIQKFVGALTGQRARKGLFITTSNYTSEAKDYVSRIDTKVVLIDGEMLAQLLIDHNVGVSTVSTFEIKKVDSDYFIEE